MFSEIICGLRGHEDVTKVEGTLLYQECIRCLRRSKGISCPQTQPTAYSNNDYHDIYSHMLDHEMHLHGGG